MMTKKNSSKKVEEPLDRHTGSAANHARAAFNKVDNRIMRYINEHGKRKVSSRCIHPQIIISGKETYQQLLGKAWQYDAKEFFVQKRKEFKHPLKFHYRVVAKIYRTGRDITLGTGVKTYRKLKRV